MSSEQEQIGLPVASIGISADRQTNKDIEIRSIFDFSILTFDDDDQPSTTYHHISINVPNGLLMDACLQ